MCQLARRNAFKSDTSFTDEDAKTPAETACGGCARASQRWLHLSNKVISIAGIECCVCAVYVCMTYARAVLLSVACAGRTRYAQTQLGATRHDAKHKI